MDLFVRGQEIDSSHRRPHLAWLASSLVARSSKLSARPRLARCAHLIPGEVHDWVAATTPNALPCLSKSLEVILALRIPHLRVTKRRRSAFVATATTRRAPCVEPRDVGEREFDSGVSWAEIDRLHVRRFEIQTKYSAPFRFAESLRFSSTTSACTRRKT
jgi:hypothetical protein